MVEQGSWLSPRQQQAFGAGETGAPPGAVAGPDAGSPARGRPLLSALVAIVLEIVVIAATANQSVSKHLLRYALDHETSFAGLALRSWLTFQWRFSPQHGDNTDGFHEWDRELLTLGVLIVLTALLVALFVRGATGFWKAFFGIWFSVLAATLVATGLGSLVTRDLAPQGFTKSTAAVFYVVNGETVFAGAVLGFVVALVTALVARLSRRAAIVPVVAAAPAADPYLPPEAPPPYYGAPGSVAGVTQPGWGSSGERPGGPQWSSRPDPQADSPTTALPPATERPPDPPRGETTPLPDGGQSADAAARERADDGGSTAALPASEAPDQGADTRATTRLPQLDDPTSAFPRQEERPPEQ